MILKNRYENLNFDIIYKLWKIEQFTFFKFKFIYKINLNKVWTHNVENFSNTIIEIYKNYLLFELKLNYKVFFN